MKKLLLFSLIVSLFSLTLVLWGQENKNLKENKKDVRGEKKKQQEEKSTLGPEKKANKNKEEDKVDKEKKKESDSPKSGSKKVDQEASKSSKDKSHPGKVKKKNTPPGLSVLKRHQKAKKLILLVTHQLNSNYDRMARFYSHIQKLRRQYPGRVMVIDLGGQWNNKDFYTRLTSHSFNVQLMNFMKYDIAAPNLLQLRTPRDQWNSILKTSKFPWILTNVFTEGQNCLPPYWIKSRGNRKVAFYAVASSKKFKAPLYKALLKKFEVREEEKALAPLIPCLSKQVDLSILLSNTGTLNDAYVATKFDSLNLLCGIGEHAKAPYLQPLNNTKIVWQEKSGRWMAQLTLTWKEKDGSSPPFEVAFQSIDSQSLSPHPEFLKYFKSLQSKVKKRSWERELTDWNNSILNKQKTREKLAHMAAVMLKKETQANLIIVHYNSVKRIDSKKLASDKNSPVTLKDLWNAFPIPSCAVEIILSGKAIETIYQKSLRDELYLYGLEVRQENGKPRLYLQGKPLRENQNYHVVTCIDGKTQIETQKVVNIIEKDFFRTFVENLERSDLPKKLKKAQD